jgi:hypothetical protein
MISYVSSRGKQEDERKIPHFEINSACGVLSKVGCFSDNIVTVLLYACSIEICLDSDNSLKVRYFSHSSKTRAKTNLAIVGGIAGGGIRHNAPLSEWRCCLFRRRWP